MTGPMPSRFEFWPIADAVASPGQIARSVVGRWTGNVRGVNIGSPWQRMRDLLSKADRYRNELADLGGPVWPPPAQRPWATLTAETEHRGVKQAQIDQLEIAERIERMIAAQECEDYADAIAVELRASGHLFESDFLTPDGCAA